MWEKQNKTMPGSALVYLPLNKEIQASLGARGKTKNIFVIIAMKAGISFIHSFIHSFPQPISIECLLCQALCC